MYNDCEKNIMNILEEGISEGDIAGASVCAIYKDEEIIRLNAGFADKENNIPMKNDTVFRMFSMTKPVTAAAAMILLERGKISLDDPLEKYIPEAEKLTVEDKNGKRPAKRGIYLKELLNMTSGLPYPEDTPAGRKAGTYFWETKNKLAEGKAVSTIEFASLAVNSPLAFSPGDSMLYGTSADVMGAVIEKAADMPFGEFIRKNITDPLEMPDTGFFITAENRHRLSQIYVPDENGALVPFTDLHLCLTDYSAPPSFESGGAGLLSTIDDYKRFGGMLLNGGIFGGVRILKEETVKFMRTNSVDINIIKNMQWDSLVGYGYNCFMRTRLVRGVNGAGIEDFGWDGWTGNYFIADPAADLVYLYFIQKGGAGTSARCLNVKSEVYKALGK